MRDFDKGDLSALTDKLYMAVSEARTDETVKGILKVFSGWMDRFNYYIGIGFWDFLVKIFKAIGVFLILVFEGTANLIKIILSWLQ